MDGCVHCYEGSPHFDYDDCVMYDENSKEWIDYAWTGNYVPLGDSKVWVTAECIERAVNFCKMCGRKLN